MMIKYDSESFSDQIVLITAGAAGIGRSIAEKFLSNGCSVHICDIDQVAIEDFLVDNPDISSSAGLFGCPKRAPYVASKWAIIGVTKTLAMELGPWGIRVNAICPGSVEGSRIERVIERDACNRDCSPEEIRKIYQCQISLRRFVTADEVANMAVFLASDMGGSISGQAIGVDGHTESLSNVMD